MKIMSPQNFTLVCVCVFFAAGAFAAETNSISTPPTTEAATQAVVNSNLQIQEQLHATLLAIESSRQQAEVEAATNTRWRERRSSSSNSKIASTFMTR